MNNLFLLFSIVIFFLIPPEVYAQENLPEAIVIEPGTPCFLDYEAGTDILQNCGAEEDFISFALLPFEWVTGGFFSMLLVTMLILISYFKYHKIAYPLIIGTLYFPIAFYLFPEHFITFAVIAAFVGITFLMIYIFIRQTKEY